MATKFRITASEARALWLDVVLLLTANVLTIYFFISQHSSVWQVLLTYYIQTVGLIYFYYKRIALANVTEVARDMVAADQYTKFRMFMRNTGNEQFAYIFVFGVPLALILFVFLQSYNGNSFLGSVPVVQGSIDYLSVAIASLVFLAHHGISYAVNVWHYRSGRANYIRIPYSRLIIRVGTVVVVVLLSPSVIQQDNGNSLFYAFMAVKTALDIALSGSYYLLNDLEPSR